MFLIKTEITNIDHFFTPYFYIFWGFMGKKYNFRLLTFVRSFYCDRLTYNILTVTTTANNSTGQPIQAPAALLSIEECHTVSYTTTGSGYIMTVTLAISHQTTSSQVCNICSLSLMCMCSFGNLVHRIS